MATLLEEIEELSISSLRENGINRYNIGTFVSSMEMHVWVTGNGVTFT